MSPEQQFAIEVLRGKITNLLCRRRKQDFILSEAQHTYMDATAAGAAVMGMGASAMGLLQMSANSAEEADWVEFELDGHHVQGWLWKMPMSEGDIVEVVAERRPAGSYFAYSIRRDNDGVIAVYPNATSGRSAFYRRIMKYMLTMFAFCYGLFCALFYSGAGGVDTTGLKWFPIAGAGVTLPFFWLLFHRAYLKMANFSRLAEVIFSSYGWSDVRQIDLVRASKGALPVNANREDFGVYYFRYQPGTSKG